MSAVKAWRRSATEAEMIRTFSDLANAGGGMCWHVRDARKQQTEGLTDLIVAIPPVVAFYELKTQRDTTSALQRQVLGVLGRCSVVESGIVRPVPKHIDELSIDEALDRILVWRPDLEIER